MRRRDFIAAAGASLLPLASHAQKQTNPVVGFLFFGTLGALDIRLHLLEALRRGLKSQGFAEGQNIAFEYREALGNTDVLRQQATELVEKRVSVIAAVGSLAPAIEARRLTSTIPIVFLSGSNPVDLGLVASLNRPGGNMTGVSFLTAELNPKRFALLKELAPKAARIGCLINPRNPSSERQVREIEEASRKLNAVVDFIPASTVAEIDTAFASMAVRRQEALLVGVDALFLGQRRQIVQQAAHYRIPASYPVREYADVGGLMSYGTILSAAYALLGEYIGRLVRGERPSDLPVQQSTRFELVLNLKTAKALGIEFPATQLALADEVIE